MNNRGWVRRLPPVDGELLSSCLARNAFAHGLPPYRFLNLVWDHDPVWSRDFDRDPGGLVRITGPESTRTSWIEDIADRLGITRAVVSDATLVEWIEALGTDATNGAADSRLILSAGVYHRTRTRLALQYCPDCLADGVPHFHKEWRLGFVTWCTTHGRPLRDACPHCDASVIPHRSMTNSLVDCHACGKKLTARGHEASMSDVPVLVRRLQDDLLDVVEGSCARERRRGGADGVGLPMTIRSLLSASAPSGFHDGLRAALGLPPATTRDGGRRRFEHARLAVRIPWLETVAAWMDDWPRNFLIGAEAIGASGRTFVRCRMSPALADQVARLPARRKQPRRPWQPLLDEPVINRLRRHDRDAYHALRARRIMNAVAVAGKSGKAEQTAMEGGT